ncbi:MAG: alpha-L-fucosidase [Bacteroidales bacterium]
MKKDRRHFLRKIAAGGMASGLLPLSLGNGLPLATGNRSGGIRNPYISRDQKTGPDPYQQNWMDLEFGMFIHFGINTYYDREWSEGDLDISVFDPGSLDTDQWCRVAKEAGMKYMVPVVKHHDGFCLWPTKYTDYSVSQTPFGKDLLGMLADSASRHGLKMGIYYSLWDSHHTLHDTDENGYVEFVKNQMEELLTGYGELVQVWFDGFWKKQQSGWTHTDGTHASPEEFIRAWRMEGAYRWQMDHLYQFIKAMQPGCMVMNNATSRYPGVPLHPVDATCGEKAFTETRYRKVWPWLGKDHYFPLEIEATMSVRGNDRFPKGNWFWHQWDHSVATVEQVRRWLELAGALDANLLLNCGPMANGRLRPGDVEVLTSLRDP